MTHKGTVGMRFEAGELLPAAVEREIKNLSLSFCDVTGFGDLQWVELKGVEGKPVRMEGPFVLLDFKGRVRTAGEVTLTDYVCTVSRQTDNGIQLLGGKLLRAEIKFLEVSLHPLAALQDRHNEQIAAQKDEQENQTVKFAFQKMESVQVDDLTARWAKAIDESDRIQQIAKQQGLNFEADEIRPNAGDIISHNQFGKCKVLRVGDDHITLRKPDGRTVQLGLAILKFIPAGTDDDKKVFKVEVKGKR